MKTKRPRYESEEPREQLVVTERLHGLGVPLVSQFRALCSERLRLLCLYQNSSITQGSHIEAWPLCRSRIVQSPRHRARIMHRRSAKIPPILPSKSATSSTMQNTRVIPDDHVPYIFPCNAHAVLLLRDVPQQRLQELVALLPGYSENVMCMCCDVEVHTTAWFVNLRDFVFVHCLDFDVDALKEIRCGFLAAVCEGVRCYIVMLYELRLQCFGEVVKRDSGVCELSVASVIRRWKLEGPEERI
jgi:hypothetical protein